MKSDRSVLEPIKEPELTRILENHGWQRLMGDRHELLALIPTGLSKRGFARLAEFFADV